MRYFWVRFVCLFSFFVLFQPAVLAQTTPDEVVSSSSPNTAEQLTLTVAQDVETQIGTSPLFLTQHGPTLHSFAVTLFPTEQPFLSPLGVAFTLQLTDTKQLSSPLQLAVDYSTIPLEQRGAALTSRLQLSQGIQCDLTTQYCLDWQPLTVQNDLSAERFTVELSSFSADTIYKVTTGVNSDQGDYGYTPLLSSSSYQVDINSGAFATQYPIVVAPAPNVVLSYNSGMIDGMHNQKNNQAGPIGLGWTLQGGFITRHLKPCSTTDLNLCSDRDRYSITLNGVSSRLIWQSGTLYRLQNDPYWKVERLPTINANNDGEYWLVTTPNGTRYRFGADPTSVFYLPINGVNNIKRAWQWNLNEIEDTNHNVTQYSYELETNYYTTTRTEYIRAGQLSQISYTTQAGSAEVATARVRFISAGRCLDYVGSDFNCITSGTAIPNMRKSKIG